MNRLGHLWGSILVVLLVGAFVGCSPPVEKLDAPPSPDTKDDAPAVTPEAGESPSVPNEVEPSAAIEQSEEGSTSERVVLASWRLDSLGEIADISGHGHTLQVQNGEDGTDVALVDGGGLRFSGDDVVVSSDAALSGNLRDDISFSCWFRSTSFDNPSMLCGWYVKEPSFKALELRLHGADQVMLNVQDSERKDPAKRNNSVRGGTNLSDGAWHHVVAVREYGKRISLYVDGELVSARNDVGIQFPDSMNFYVAGLYGYKGDIDAVSLWKGALSAEEVKALTAAGRG